MSKLRDKSRQLVNFRLLRLLKRHAIPLDSRIARDFAARANWRTRLPPQFCGSQNQRELEGHERILVSVSCSSEFSSVLYQQFFPARRSLQSLAQIRRLLRANRKQPIRVLPVCRSAKRVRGSLTEAVSNQQRANWQVRVEKRQPLRCVKPPYSL